MTLSTVISALCLPAAAQVNQRVPKKMLVENGAHTAADKRKILDGIEEIHWLAALKPSTIGVPIFRDDTREYLEIAVLAITLRESAKLTRLTELIHRAIPYPCLLIQTLPAGAGMMLSLAHIRWAQGGSGQTVLETAPIIASLEVATPITHAFLTALSVTSQPSLHLYALYQCWVELFEALAAARFTGSFSPPSDANAAEQRRSALAEYDRLTRQITSLRALAAKETQMNRRVELNLQLKQIESCLAKTAYHF